MLLPSNPMINNPVRKDIYRGQERLTMKITIIFARILGNSSSPRGNKTPQFSMYDKIKITDSRIYQLINQKQKILKVSSLIKFSTKLPLLIIFQLLFFR